MALVGALLEIILKNAVTITFSNSTGNVLTSCNKDSIVGMKRIINFEDHTNENYILPQMSIFYCESYNY